MDLINKPDKESTIYGRPQRRVNEKLRTKIEIGTEGSQ